MNYKNLGVFSVIVMFFLAACSASTPVIPINTLPSSVISVKNENFSVDFEKCESELTLSSNVKCSFLVTNLKNIAQDVTADRSTVIILNSDNTTYSVDNLAFSGGVLDVSSKAAFPPLGRLKLEMRLTLPKGVTTIIQLSVSLGKYGPLIGKMANLNVDGSPQDMNPSSALPGGTYIIDSQDEKVKFGECKPVARVGSNLQCRFTFVNLRGASRPIASRVGEFKFNSSDGLALINDDLSFDGTTFDVFGSATIAPNGSVDAFIDFNVPAGTTKIPQLDFKLQYPYSTEGSFRQIPVTGVVRNPLPINTLPAGVYSFDSDFRRVKLEQCSVSTVTAVMSCRISIVNFQNKSRDLIINARNVSFVLPSGTTGGGAQIRFADAAFAASASSKLPPNGQISADVVFNSMAGASKLPELTIDTGYPYYLKGTFKEVPVSITP